MIRPVDMELIMLKREQAVYRVDSNLIIEIGIDVGGDELFPLVRLHPDELQSVEPVSGIPTAYIDYQDGGFRVWPTPDRDIRALVTSQMPIE